MRNDIRRLKSKYWENGFYFDSKYKDSRYVCFHSRDIRRHDGAFNDKVINYNEFISDLSYTLNSIQCDIISVTIDIENFIKNIEEDILDRFGKMPKEIINLLEIAKIKGMCKNLGITKINQKQNNIVFNFNPESFIMDIDKIVKKYKNRVKFSPAREPYITYKLENSENVLEEIIDFLEIK